VVDPLESRALLAATLLADGTLQVTGSEGPDQVTLRRGAEPNKLNVQEGATTLFVFLLDQVNSIDINLGAGDDALNVDMTPGLLTAPSGDLPIRIDGGVGNDSLHMLGAPAGGAWSEVLSLGADPGAGTLVGRVAAGPAQALQFAGLESVVDTSVAASLSLAGNDARNVIEVTAGPLVGGVTPSGAVRFFDVSPAQPTPTPPSPGPSTPDADPKHDAKRLAKAAKKEAKREAKRLAKEAKRLAREQRKADESARKRKTAPPAEPAPPVVVSAAVTASAESLAVNRAYLTIYFANKAAVTLDAQAGDDRVDVNLTGAAPAGLQTLSIDGGAGADALARQSVPAGVTLQELNLESTSATRNFATTSTTAPAVEPPVPAEPPPTPAGGDDHDHKDDDKEDKNDN
jgi:hypothetical protein